MLSPDRGRWITACNICTLKIPSEGQPLIDPSALMGRRRSLWPPTATRWGDAAALQPPAVLRLPGTRRRLRSAQHLHGPGASIPEALSVDGNRHSRGAPAVGG